MISRGTAHWDSLVNLGFRADTAIHPFVAGFFVVGQWVAYSFQSGVSGQWVAYNSKERRNISA
jgi:hypothetical protein